MGKYVKDRQAEALFSTGRGPEGRGLFWMIGGSFQTSREAAEEISGALISRPARVISDPLGPFRSWPGG